jgi:hypothetical protein
MNVQPPGVFSTWEQYNDWLRSYGRTHFERLGASPSPRDNFPPSPAHPAPPDGRNGRAHIGGREYCWCRGCGQWELIDDVPEAK